MDAERAHGLVCALLRLLSICPWALGWISGGSQIRATKIGELEFLNPVGLAAGFDKDGKLLRALPELGFGFVEVGTVTLHPQAGNKQPRLFRIPESQALFNRMGFNSSGAPKVAENIRKAKTHLPKNFRVGVNLGKNKDTPPHQVADEHAVCASFFEGLADFFVVNLSSPNTPGLRDLQNEEMVQQIISRVRQVMKSWKIAPPIYLKLAPELEAESLIHFCKQAASIGIDGFVLTNTLKTEFRAQAGGLSGAPVRETSRRALELARTHFSGPIISVGGIDSRAEAEERFRLGASLVEVYTGWVYEGPRLVSKILSKNS